MVASACSWWKVKASTLDFFCPADGMHNASKTFLADWLNTIDTTPFEVDCKKEGKKEQSQTKQRWRILVSQRVAFLKGLHMRLVSVCVVKRGGLKRTSLREEGPKWRTPKKRLRFRALCGKTLAFKERIDTRIVIGISCDLGSSLGPVFAFRSHAFQRKGAFGVCVLKPLRGEWLAEGRRGKGLTVRPEAHLSDSIFSS